jgi:RNA polymerase sigma-70 factor (sigma-E family)
MRADWEREYSDYAGACLARLERTAWMLCGDRHQAADLVQNTLVKIYVRWPKVRAVEHLDAYVRKALLREFLSEQRRPWARIRLTGAVPDDAVQPDDATEDRSMLVDALRQMAPRQRAVLVLRFLLDLPIEEVAEQLDCSTGTVKSQTSKGLAVMRRLMDLPAVVPSTSGGTDG